MNIWVGEIVINKYDFFKSKFRTLESFYMWIEQGSTYDVAVEQCMYYDRPQNELDDIVIAITIATRFVRSEKPLAEKFKTSLQKKIQHFSTLDLSKYGLNEDELRTLNQEIDEVDSYLHILG